MCNLLIDYIFVYTMLAYPVVTLCIQSADALTFTRQPRVVLKKFHKIFFVGRPKVKFGPPRPM